MKRMLDFRCKECQHEFEIFAKQTTKTSACPECGGKGHVLLSAPGMIKVRMDNVKDFTVSHTKGNQRRR